MCKVEYKTVFNFATSNMEQMFDRRHPQVIKQVFYVISESQSLIVKNLGREFPDPFLSDKMSCLKVEETFRVEITDVTYHFFYARHFLYRQFAVLDVGGNKVAHYAAEIFMTGVADK